MSLPTKQNLRRAVRCAVASLSDSERRELSFQIFSRVAALDEVQGSQTIALFASLPDEPQSAELIEQLSRHKRIVLPRIEGGNMEFYDISEGLKEGYFGIMEPIAATPVAASEIDVMVVPGVIFTREGARCGRGKGFYDRHLANEGFRAYTIGVCYPCQIVEELPTEEHDRKVDKVIF